MRYKSTKLAAGTLFPLLVFLLSLTSCARTPWTTSIEGDPRNAIERAFASAAEKSRRCSSGWDAEITVNWTSASRNYAFTGYCQTLEPSYLKLVVSNPLGQPLKLIAIDGSSYQLVDAAQRSSVSGSLRSWAIRNQIPLVLSRRPWLDWLLGRPSDGDAQIIDVRNDDQNRGVWLSIGSADNPQIQEHVLFAADESIIVERVLLDDQGSRVATITYSDWQRYDACPFPAKIAVTGLAFGTAAEVAFSDVRSAELTPESFSLKIPQGFSRTFLP